MFKRTPYLPPGVEPDGSPMDLRLKGFAPQMDSVEIERPTGRLARVGAEVAA